jgi:hypothetical protein
MAEKTKPQDRIEREAIKAKINNPVFSSDRRNFLKKAALGGMIHLSVKILLHLTHRMFHILQSPRIRGLPISVLLRKDLDILSHHESLRSIPIRE